MKTPSLLTSHTATLTSLAALMTISLAACAAPTATNQPSAQSGQLTIYTTRAEALFKPVVAEFNKTNPSIKISLLSGKSGELGAKLAEEKANPQADVFVGTDMLAAIDLAAQGIFTPITSAKTAQIPERYRATDNAWVGLTLRPRVIMYNKNLVKPEELPKSIFDLTDPKWKGQVGAANSTNDAMTANLAALRKLIGPEKTEKFVKDLVANNTQFFGGHTDVRKAVGAGELKLGFVNHYYYHLSRVEGAPVGIIYPDLDTTGLIVNTTVAGVVKGSKNSAVAQAFVDFLLSPAGQKVFADNNYEYPIVSGVALADGVDALDKYKINDLQMQTLYNDLKNTKQMMQQAGLP